ncbi:MAG: transporter, ATPase subunit [Candidatus Angelobacter sp.]|nr:transporter, ATPase subunit [Candidatus Angelobacter sp.]
MNAIEISGLQKSYSVGFFRKTEKVALKDLSLEVHEGEIFGYLGPNGAGKTTTLKLLMGLMFPTRGWAKILGKDIDDPLVRASVGFLPEQPYFYDYLTAAELLEYYAQLSGVPAKERGARARKMLERVGLAGSENTQLRKFSKGMLQRAGIAQAIVHDPKILFLDEPMSGLDPIGRREVRDLIQELHDEGKTIFFSTHILSDAETLCDRVAVLNKGELRGIGVVADLLADSGNKVEVVWQGSAATAAVCALNAECHTTGEIARAIVAKTMLDAAIDAIRRAKGNLISVTPVQTTLEEYFLKRIEQGATAGGNAKADSAVLEVKT